MKDQKELRRGAGIEQGAEETSEEFDLDGLPQAEAQQESMEVGSESDTEEGGSGTREGEAEGAIAEPTAPTASSVPVSFSKDVLTEQVESILEDGLGELYRSMTPEQQGMFRAKGESVAQAIRLMIETAHFSFKKVVKLIEEWLRMIPGVNKFFLEQEAKIKADRLSHVNKEGG